MQAWWNDALVYSNYFFDTFKFDAPENELFIMLSEMRMIRASFAQADYPASVGSARQHLLNSMTRVLDSFQAFVAGNTEIAQQYMDHAQKELHHMHSELARLGIPTIPLELPLH